MRPPRRALQKPREGSHDGVADVIAEAAKRWDDWLQRCRSTIAERYLRLQCGFQLHVLIRIAPDEAVSHKYCIRIQAVERCDLDEKRAFGKGLRFCCYSD